MFLLIYGLVTLISQALGQPNKANKFNCLLLNTG